MYVSKQIFLPIDSFSLFLRTHKSGPALGICGTIFERIAVRAVVTIQQFCSHAATFWRVLRETSLSTISLQDCRARLPMGRSDRTLQAQTSDHGSMNAKSFPAVQGIRRSWPRI